jgi:hypothetical protein
MGCRIVAGLDVVLSLGAYRRGASRARLDAALSRDSARVYNQKNMARIFACAELPLASAGRGDRLKYFAIFFIFCCVTYVFALGAFYMHRIKRLRLMHDARVQALRGTENQRN